MTDPVHQAIITFIAQYIMVFAAGFQSMSVNHGHYKLAAFNSFLLGVLGYHLTAVIAQMGAQGALGVVWLGYVVAGPLGIVSSMKFHQWMKNRRAIKGSQ